MFKSLKIVLCLPGSSFGHETMLSIIDLISFMKLSGITPIISCRQSPVVYYVRNLCLGADSLKGVNQAPFGGQDYDYIMWIDSDIVFLPEQFKKLLDWNVDICSGIYKMSDNYSYATCMEWSKEKLAKQGHLDFLNMDSIKNLQQNKLAKVAYTGLGFTLVKRGVFEKIGYPFFKPRFYEIQEINFLDFTSEDCGFCLDAKDSGFDTHIDPSVIVGHKKSFVI